MRLPMYITGLANNPIDINKMDGYLFKKLGYEIARELHEYFPYVAIASYVNELQIHYLDCEDVINKLRPYYTVLEMRFLNEHFNPNSYEFSEIELKTDKYWSPNTNGEVIYNCWD